MLRRDDRLYYIGKIVDVWQGFDAEDNVVKGSAIRNGIFRAWNDYPELAEFDRNLVALTITRLETLIAKHFRSRCVRWFFGP